MTDSALFDSPEQLAANPPETWRVTRVQRGSRAEWEVRIHTDSDYPAATFATKREAMLSVRPSGRFGQVYEGARRYFAGESVEGTPYRHHTPYADVIARREAEAEAVRRSSERAGLPVAQMERWRALVNTGDVAEMAGALHDVLGELLDWFDSAHPLSMNALNVVEAREVHRELSEVWGFTSDVVDELHRVKVLHIGADRTALEVLEDLAQGEREREQFARIGVAA